MADGAARDAEVRWQVTIAQTLDEVERLRPVWRELQRREPVANLNADVDRYLSVVRSLAADSRPYVILLSRDGAPAAMLIARLEPRGIKIAIGYKALCRPKLSCLTVIHGGVLGQPDAAAAERLVAEVRRVLSAGEVDVAYFNNLPVDSAAYRAARRAGGFFRRDHFTPAAPHWVMDLPGSMDEFYASLSKVSRKSMRRSLKLLEKETPGGFEHVLYRREQDLPEMFSALKCISSKTYQYAMGAAFADTPEQRERLSDAAGRGWLRTHVLKIAGAPCAFEMAFEYEGTLFLYESGYDAGLRHLSPGKALFLMMLDQLCRQRTVERIDFGLGDADYKRVYCKTKWLESEVYVFAPAFRPFMVNLARTCAMGASLAFKYALNKLGAARRIKRGWRDRLRRTASTESEGETTQDGDPTA